MKLGFKVHFIIDLLPEQATPSEERGRHVTTRGSFVGNTLLWRDLSESGWPAHGSNETVPIQNAHHKPVLSDWPGGRAAYKLGRQVISLLGQSGCKAAHRLPLRRTQKASKG